MKHLYKILLTVFICVCICTPQILKAQNGFDVIYDFCPDTPIVSSITSTLAENDRYFVGGSTMTPGLTFNNGFVAAFDYSGQVLWQRALNFPGLENGFSGTDFLHKVDSNKYYLNGTIIDGDSRYPVLLFQTYFYFFNNGKNLSERKQIG